MSEVVATIYLNWKGARPTPNYAKAEAALPFLLASLFVCTNTKIEVPAGNLNTSGSAQVEIRT